MKLYIVFLIDFELLFRQPQFAVRGNLANIDKAFFWI